MEEHAGPQRRRWVEIVLVGVVVAEYALSLLLSSEGVPWGRVVAVSLGMLLGLALLLRRRYWRWLLPVVLAANVVSMSVVVFAVAPYAYTNRMRRPQWTILVTVLAVASATMSQFLVPGGSRLETGVFTATVALSSALLGMYTRARRDLMHELRARAEEAEQRQATAEASARRAERTRIAREMHDIVAHKISLVTLQAGALEVNDNLPTKDVQQSAGLIRETAADALSELREVLGVMRGDEEGAPLMPQPTWEDVRRLVDSSRDAGVEVELFDFIDTPVPDPLARTVYRVVQEGLTNIHKHARHTRARIALIGDEGEELLVEISNVLPKGFTTDLPGARMGLSGIETRVSHAGGTITSGPTDDGHFEVKAVIPWPERTA